MKRLHIILPLRHEVMVPDDFDHRDPEAIRHALNTQPEGEIGVAADDIEVFTIGEDGWLHTPDCQGHHNTHPGLLPLFHPN